jgi:3-deoxy-D-manno-octulosonic-acid transferase
MRFVIGRILRQYARILAREETDRKRFVAIGAPSDIVETSGNVKFDYEPDDTPLDIAPQLRAIIGNRHVLVLGSTMEGEDEALMPEVESLLRDANAFVIIAPRKPERFELVAGLLATTSLRFVRRSDIGNEPIAADVLLLDTIGELARIYGHATAAFIGGTLEPFGGHNPIEAAATGVPVCFGPFMSNFREIAEVFLKAEAAAEVGTAADVMTFARRMFEDPAARQAMGERARTTVQQNRGASARTARRIVELLA